MDVSATTWRGRIYSRRMPAPSQEFEGPYLEDDIIIYFSYPGLSLFLKKYLSANLNHISPCLQSCTKVAVDFVCPENIRECLRLTEEFRQLPKNHRAREDKLEVNSCSLLVSRTFTT